jgi:hypothetical protein
MKSVRRFLAAFSAVIAVSLGLAVWSTAKADDSKPAPSASGTSYLPSTADLMLATIQPRHVKLWMAAQQKNWKLAAYELETLTGAFRRLVVAHSEEDGTPLKEMVESVVQQPFADLEQAIRAKDETQFNKAYGDLTNGCNSCHQALNHGEVVIGMPKDTLFSDQVFAPAQP